MTETAPLNETAVDQFAAPQPSATAEAVLLRAVGVTKRFAGVTALDGVSLELRRGEVLALVGENGAGKSTLMKILAGVYSPDAGGVWLDGRLVRIDSVRTAQSLGIGLIHQELNLAENLDIGANILLGREPRWLGVLLDRAAIRAEAARALELVGLNLHPDTPVAELSIGRRQMVEIAKALSQQARILIMDEPTSSLSEHEASALFAVVRDLRRRGVCVVYISHRLREVAELADRVTVLRDGRNAGELVGPAITPEAMVSRMVGRDLSAFYSRGPHPPGEPMLEVEGLVVPTAPSHRISLSVRAGEVVGLAGLVGAGRTELLLSLFGVEPALAGRVRVAGRPVLLRRPIDAVRAGLALVPEDRKEQGLLLEMTVRENVSLAGLRLGRNRGPGGRLLHSGERADTERAIRDLSIRPPLAEAVAGNLSGGNQQKIVLAKWLLTRPRVLLLDEPTRGVDVGAKEEMYRLIDRAAAEGAAVLVVSSDMQEVLGLSDRVLVMHEGRLAGELPRSEMTEQAIMRLATGSH